MRVADAQDMRQARCTRYVSGSPPLQMHKICVTLKICDCVISIHMREAQDMRYGHWLSTTTYALVPQHMTWCHTDADSALQILCLKLVNKVFVQFEAQLQSVFFGAIRLMTRDRFSAVRLAAALDRG